MRYEIPLLSALLACTACAPAASESSVADTGPQRPAAITDTWDGMLIDVSTEVAQPALIAAPHERVWEVLPAVYDGLGIEAEVNDRASWSYGTRQFTQARIAGKRTGSFVRCGSDGSGGSSGARRMHLTVLSEVRPAPDGFRTSITTVVEGTATRVDGSSTGAVRCVSTGELEQRIRQLAEEWSLR